MRFNCLVLTVFLNCWLCLKLHQGGVARLLTVREQHHCSYLLVRNGHQLWNSSGPMWKIALRLLFSRSTTVGKPRTDGQSKLVRLMSSKPPQSHHQPLNLLSPPHLELAIIALDFSRPRRISWRGSTYGGGARVIIRGLNPF